MGEDPCVRCESPMGLKRVPRPGDGRNERAFMWEGGVREKRDFTFRRTDQIQDTGVEARFLTITEGLANTERVKAK